MNTHLDSIGQDVDDKLVDPTRIGQDVVHMICSERRFYFEFEYNVLAQHLALEDGQCFRDEISRSTRDWSDDEELIVYGYDAPRLSICRYRARVQNPGLTYLRQSQNIID